MRWTTTLTAFFVLSCAGQIDCPDTPAVRHRLAVIGKARPELQQTIYGMDVLCRADLTGVCGSDSVGACTQSLGRPGVVTGRTYIRLDQPVDTALAHEAVHWLVWDTDQGCPDHDPSCFDFALVEHLQEAQ